MEWPSALAATIKFDEEGGSLGYSDGSLVSAKFPRESEIKRERRAATKGDIALLRV